MNFVLKGAGEGGFGDSGGTILLAWTILWGLLKCQVTSIDNQAGEEAKKRALTHNSGESPNSKWGPTWGKLNTSVKHF